MHKLQIWTQCILWICAWAVKPFAHCDLYRQMGSAAQSAEFAGDPLYGCWSLKVHPGKHNSPVICKRCTANSPGCDNGGKKHQLLISHAPRHVSPCPRGLVIEAVTSMTKQWTISMAKPQGWGWTHQGALLKRSQSGDRFPPLSHTGHLHIAQYKKVWRSGHTL